MQTYRCTCGNRIFFENTVCLACQREVGWCEACCRMTSLEPVGGESDPTSSASGQYLCGHTDCRQPLQKCHNYVVEHACNRCCRAEAKSQPTGNGTVPVATETSRLCSACQLTETIPDLSIDGNREKWARLEAAKRRLLYTLD